MSPNIIRALIFLTAGLATIIFQKQLYIFHTYLYKKLHIKYDQKSFKKYYNHLGIIMIIIAIILFKFSIKAF